MLDASEELQIYRYKNGIKLLKSQIGLHKKNSHLGVFIEQTVCSLLELPIPVFFSNTDHLSIKCNDLSAIECGYQSSRDIIKKPWYYYFSRNTVAEPLANSNEIMLKSTAKITYENALRKDGSQNDALTIRMPWYDADNKIVGLFGCAILPHKNPLGESLTLLANTGLLDFKQIKHSEYISGQVICSVYLSKREIECLKLTIRGQTAKSIAKILKLSHWTIEEYLANIKNKLGVQTKSELIDKAIDSFFHLENTPNTPPTP